MNQGSAYKAQLVLPAYNEPENLENLINRAVEAAKEFGHDATTFQLVLVNNGSTDKTAAVLNRLKKSDLAEWFHVVQIVKNQGYGFGVKMGLRACSAPIIGWSHADLQCDPKDFFKSVKIASDESANVLVKGIRRKRALKDQFVTTVFEFLARRILGLKTGEINAQPKVFPKSFLPHVINGPDTFELDIYTLYQAHKKGYDIKTIEVDFPPRIHGISKWAHSLMGRYEGIKRMFFYMLQLRNTEGKLQ